MTTYGFIISLAAFVSFLYLFITSYKKEFPLLFKLMFGILMSAPILVFGARIWTLFDPNFMLELNNSDFLNEKINLFFGFPNGISGLSFHGGLLFGFIYIFFLFSWYSKRTKISKLYLFDWFVPAVLIMQIIGRLGNYFNDELTGRFNEEPLFLYEMIGNFIILLIIIFVIPNIYKIFSKKPWNNNVFWKNEISKNYIKFKKTKGLKKIKQYFIYLNVKNIFWNKALNEYPKLKENISIKIKGTNNFYYRELEKVKNEKSFLKKIYKKIKLLFLRDSSDLLENNNPFDLKLIRVGVISCFYIIFSFSLRLGLQFLRKKDDQMDITIPFLIIFIILGFIFFFLFQFIFPNKFRTKEWYYESKY